MNQCKYKYELTSDKWWHCSEDAWAESSEGFCVYHSTKNGKDEATARKVWQEARKRSQNAKGCDFMGWHFPDDPEKKWFIETTFQASAKFKGATFQGPARLRGAVSLRYSWFHRAIFQGHAIFNGATFKSDAGFFIGAIFRNEAWFYQAIFEGAARFNGGTFWSKAFFDMTDFQDDAMFGGVKFQGEAHFGRVNIRGNAWFERATFKCDTLFNQATFRSDAMFDRAAFHGPTAFGGATFAGKVFFTFLFPLDGTIVNIDIPSYLHAKRPFFERRPFRRPAEGETLYHFAKECAQRQGNYSMAGEYHFAEQCAIQCGKCKRYGWRFWGWLPRWFFPHAIFGYGERLVRPLVTGLLVIVIWALLYSALGGVAPGGLAGEAGRLYEPGFWESFYFSLVTFTTLGYGDMAPKTHILFRLLAGGEALLGAGLMALFIVALARKYTR